MWKGSKEYEAQVLGRSGGYARVGDTAVPRRVTFTATGSKGSPDVTARFEIRDGRPQCVEITVKADRDGRGIRTSDVEMLLPLDRFTEDAFQRYTLRVRGRGVLSSPADEREAWAANRDLATAQVKPGRAVSAAELEDVARVYQEAEAAPLQQVEQVLGYSRRTAARRVALARERGLL